MQKFIITVGFIIAVNPISVAWAEEIQSLENISKELVKIRQQIETLHNKINFEKEAYQDQLRSFVSQKSDLQVRLSRSELNIKELQRELKKLSERNKEKHHSQNKLTPILHQAITSIRESVQSSLPFKLEQRLKALDDIEQRLSNNIISPNKASNQLWAYLEDELMLGKSSGIYNDTLTIDGQARLVKVLRIGKVGMFYKTQDNHFGVVRKQADQWQQQVLNDADSKTYLGRLFDSFTKNIRNGQFRLPNFLPKTLTKS